MCIYIYIYVSVGKSQRQGKLHGLNRVQTAGIRMFMLQFSGSNVLVVNPKINRILAARNSDHVYRFICVDLFHHFFIPFIREPSRPIKTSFPGPGSSRLCIEMFWAAV